MAVFLILLVLFNLCLVSAGIFRGIRLCERECQLSTRCSAVNFDPVHLRCTLLSAVTPSPDGFVLAVKKRLHVDARVRNCHGRLLLTRRDHPACIPPVMKEHQLASTYKPCGIKKESGAKLLVLPYNTIYRYQGCEVDLTTGVTTVCEASWNGIQDLAVKKSCLIISFHKSIVSVQVSTQKRTIIKLGWGFRDIRVDEEAGWIFYTYLNEGRKATVARVTFTGMQYRSLITNKPCWYFDLDRTKKIIYVATPRGITSLSYVGTVLEEFQHGPLADLVAVDPASGIVYLASKKAILKLKEKQTTLLWRLNFVSTKLMSMRVHFGVLYIAMDTKNTWIRTFRLSDRKLSRIDLPLSGRSGLILAPYD